jgi:hypothetical protein
MRMAAMSGAGPETCIVGKNCVTTLTTVKSTLKHVALSRNSTGRPFYAAFLTC